MKNKPLYVETTITCNLDELWAATQDPSRHQEWDLRFSEIDYLPKDDPASPQQFRYATRMGFGMTVEGKGESVATKTNNHGVSTSVLKFSSDSLISIIKEGSGYWKYIPEGKSIRFLTGYDYQTRWGILGSAVDRWIFRPMMRWATAWSFDCLKNHMEKGIHPRQAITAQVSVLLIHILLGIVWVYQGLVPKLAFPDTGELDILRASGVFPGYEETVLLVVGIAEMAFGVGFWWTFKKGIHVLNILGLTFLAVGALFSDMMVFVQPFNPFALNISMMGLSIIALLHIDSLPKASNCITNPKQ
ncbi:DoxX-like family protein [Algivirga pacifica]|uniref:DoxX-like family protein n=1 Tax=Algivirga pacifica TaxID=1162670 RepID=A0ABP9D7L5_9BACT